MQLILILAALLLGGGSNQKLLKEVKPVLEEIGGEEVKSAFSAVEEISGVLNMVKDLSAAQSVLSSFNSNVHSDQHAEAENNFCSQSGYPLEPVAKIADKSVTYSLSKYFAENA